MKTPDEIKKGLACCTILEEECIKCPSGGCPGSPSLHDDALAYIQQLETKCHQLERERDAAVDDMTTVIYNGAEIVCQFCKHKDEHKCAQICGFGFRGFEWRGVKGD